MISMMYLVLTAMLALNVSTDVLKAFKMVDDSLHTTLSTTDSRNRVLMSDFRAQRDDNPQKVGEWYTKAEELTRRSDSLFNFIQDVKKNIAISADGAKKADPEGRAIENNDNREAAARYALPNVGEQPGAVLRTMVEDYREFLISLDTTRAAEYNTMFDTSSKIQKDGSSQSWDVQMFLDMPAGAAVTLMTKLQNDVRNAQNIMIQHLRRQTDAGDLRVNKLNAYVIPNSRTVIKGGKYTAQIVLAAVDSTQTPEYYVEGQRLNDQGLYEAVAASAGRKKYSGWISYMNPATGEMENLRFDEEYEVQDPALLISHQDLTVLYRDYANRLAISIPNVADDKLQLSVSGGTASIKKEGSLWVVKPTGNATKLRLVVTAQHDGRTIRLESKDEYRVFDLPKPRGYFYANKTQFDGEKTVPRNALIDEKATMEAGYGPDVFLKVDYVVESFKARISGTVTNSNGNRFSADQLRRIKNLDPGTTISIVDIKVRPKEGGNLIPISAFPLEIRK